MTDEFKILDEFEPLKSFLNLDQVWIDNLVFRLHYKATCVIFVTATVFLGMTQYFGDPIDCIVEGVDNEIMDLYCWIHSTYSVPTRYYIDNLLFLLPYYDPGCPFL